MPQIYCKKIGERSCQVDIALSRPHTLPHRDFISAHVWHTMDVAPARQGGKTEGWVAQEVVRLVRTAASNGKIPQAQAEAIVGATVH